MLFQLWTNQPHRPTRDLDLLGRGDDSLPRFVTMFQEICNLPVEDDGLVFLAQSVQGERIKEDQEYEGLRLRMSCRLENARIPIQIDIGFGDVVMPAAAEVTYPVLLDFPAPVLPAYSRESVVAEKYHAMVTLGIANSRMKDFYDLWILARASSSSRGRCSAKRSVPRSSGDGRRSPARPRWPCRPNSPATHKNWFSGGRFGQGSTRCRKRRIE